MKTGTFFKALGWMRTGKRVRRLAWSLNPHDDNYHCSLVIDKNGIVYTRWRNRLEATFLSLTDYKAKDWIIDETIY